MLPDDAVKMGPLFPPSEMEFYMREYRPQRPALLFQGALFFASLGATVFVIAMLIAKWGSHDQASLVALSIPGLLILLPSTGGIGWSLFHALAAYRIDPQGITQIRFGQQTLFLWREIVDFRFGRIGQSDTHWTLRDSAGRTLTVHTGMLERGYGLAGLIDTYLAPLRELKCAQIQQAPQVYRCGKAGSIAMVICSLVFFSMVGLTFFGSIVQTEPGWSVGLPICTLFFGGMGTLVLGYALHYATWTVRITPSALISTSLFSRKRLAFSQIVAFFPNAAPLKNGQTQRTTEIVGQDGTKIKLNPVLMDDELLTANLQSMMNTPVLDNPGRDLCLLPRLEIPARRERDGRDTAMKPGPHRSTPEEKIATPPLLRQGVPTITIRKAELQRNRRLILLPLELGIYGVVALIGGGGVLLTLQRIFPGIESGRPMTAALYVLLMVIGVGFLGGVGLPAVLPTWLDRQIRDREANYCDTQLIGELIDTVQAIQQAESGGRKGGYGGCVQALLQRSLPEIHPLEAAALTENQRDFLVERALSSQTEEEFVLLILRSAPVWGDIETLPTLLMLARTAESEAVRAAAYTSFTPLKVRLLAERENAALVYSLEIPALPS